MIELAMFCMSAALLCALRFVVSLFSGDREGAQGWLYCSVAACVGLLSGCTLSVLLRLASFLRISLANSNAAVIILIVSAMVTPFFWVSRVSGLLDAFNCADSKSKAELNETEGR